MNFDEWFSRLPAREQEMMRSRIEWKTWEWECGCPLCAKAAQATDHATQVTVEETPGVTASTARVSEMLSLGNGQYLISKNGETYIWDSRWTE